MLVLFNVDHFSLLKSFNLMLYAFVKLSINIIKSKIDLINFYLTQLFLTFCGICLLQFLQSIFLIFTLI